MRKVKEISKNGKGKQRKRGRKKVDQVNEGSREDQEKK